MSIPSTDLLLHEFCVCGRASTSTVIVKANMRNIIDNGISITFQLFGA